MNGAVEEIHVRLILINFSCVCVSDIFAHTSITLTYPVVDTQYGGEGAKAEYV